MLYFFIRIVKLINLKFSRYEPIFPRDLCLFLQNRNPFFLAVSQLKIFGTIQQMIQNTNIVE